MFRWFDRQAVFDQADVAKQLSEWYEDTGNLRLRRALDALMRSWLNTECGRYALCMSAFQAHSDWFGSSGFKSFFQVGSLGTANVISSFEELPIDTESLDLVVACHALEFAGDPHRLLREIDRVLVPQGRCIIVVFNPLGFQGVARPFKLFRNAPWCGRFYSLPRIRDWLSVLGFSIEKSSWLSPPFVIPGEHRLGQSLDFVLAGGLFWMCSLIALYTRKEVSRMIPICEPWKQDGFPEVKTAQPAASCTSNV